ncbi:MAG: hypothetical protein IPK87_09605 [Planctomycetes bacterium]|nr:hypothetical protein [Planctomycetota bacterium]
MKILLLSLKGVKNNRMRAALTMLGVAVAVFVFVFFASTRHTMSNVVAEAGKDNNLVVMKENTW